MKRTEMLEIKASREPILGFLGSIDIVKFREILQVPNVDKLNFSEVCDLVLDAHRQTRITNRVASNLFETLREANSMFKTESHRYELGKIYEYLPEYKSYMFLKSGTKQEFNALNHYL